MSVCVCVCVCLCLHVSSRRCVSKFSANLLNLGWRGSRLIACACIACEKLVLRVSVHFLEIRCGACGLCKSNSSVSLTKLAELVCSPTLTQFQILKRAFETVF